MGSREIVGLRHRMRVEDVLMGGGGYFFFFFSFFFLFFQSGEGEEIWSEQCRGCTYPFTFFSSPQRARVHIPACVYAFSPLVSFSLARPEWERLCCGDCATSGFATGVVGVWGLREVV
jgi:hypothetical protein